LLSRETRTLTLRLLCRSYRSISRLSCCTLQSIKVRTSSARTLTRSKSDRSISRRASSLGHAIDTKNIASRSWTSIPVLYVLVSLVAATAA
jgi:hypothetical protein